MRLYGCPKKLLPACIIANLNLKQSFIKSLYNGPMQSSISLGIFDLSGVIMLVLAGTCLAYLYQVKKLTAASRMLRLFFICVMLSAIATIITNSGLAWDWAFAPSQDAFLILGGVFLVRFAHLYPEKDQPNEARWTVTLFALLAAAALTFSVSFAFRYIANLPGDLKENPAYYLILPAAISITVILFFRRSVMDRIL